MLCRILQSKNREAETLQEATSQLRDSKVSMLFFFEEDLEQLGNDYATTSTSQKEFPKDGNRRYTKFPVNVA